MNCPHCNIALSDAARFCPACGKATSGTEPSSNPDLAKERSMIGREIAGRYRILAKLGEGGMGSVFRAEQISLKRTVAVKLLRPDVSENPLILRRFNAEAEAVAKLGHPNTVNIYDFGQDVDGSLFIAMEFIEGRSLRLAIAQEAPLPPARALSIASQVAASLADAHARSIVHRDLKPDNVMLQDRGRQRDIVRVLDFGIAKLRDESHSTQQAMTKAGDVLGTPQYMAPEQIRGETVDGRTDVYALGCMIYEMLTGRMPFEAGTIMAVMSKHLVDPVIAPSVRRPDLGLSPALDQLVLTAMMKEPRARPPTMELYGEQIAAVLAALPPDPRYPIGPMSGQAHVVTPPAHSAYLHGAAQPNPPSFAPPGSMHPPPAVAPPASVHASGPSPVGAPPMYAAAVATPVAPPMHAFGHSPNPVGHPAQLLPPAPLPTPPHLAPPHPKSRAGLYIVLAVLAIGGISVGAWAMTRSKKADPWDRDAGPPAEPIDKPVKPAEPDKPPEPDKPAEPAKDPWANQTPSIGNTAGANPNGLVPDGARLLLPAGFTTKQGPGPGGHTIINQQSHMAIALSSLPLGVDETQFVLELSKQPGAHLDGNITVASAGGLRNGVRLSTAVNGVPIYELVVFFPNRLAVIAFVPKSVAAQHGFEEAARQFWANNVVLP